MLSQCLSVESPLCKWGGLYHDITLKMVLLVVGCFKSNADIMSEALGRREISEDGIDLEM